MSIISVCGVAVILAVIVVFFKQIKSEFALPLVLVCSILLLKNTLSVLLVNFEFLNSLLDSSYLGEYSDILFKTFGISLTVQTASDICRDAGESSIASKIELFGKAEILVISIPLIKKILEVTQEIIT